MHAILMTLLLVFAQEQTQVNVITLEKEDTITKSSISGFLKVDLQSQKRIVLIRADTLYLLESAPENKKYESHKIYFSTPDKEDRIMILVPSNYMSWDELLALLKTVL